ncbi:MAG: YitT family protein [Clostridiales bacterium]|jgi:uncharacterized membrane-anchored protein YitT (DUF2179 family)|nr:YitT family protein [Clostridiales bacterium]
MFKLDKSFWFIQIGLFLVALDIYLFKTPNKFALGGTSGISILILKFYPQASVGLLMFSMNVILLIFAYFILGKRFVINTIYGSFAVSFLVWLFAFVFPITKPLTNQKLLELIYSVFLPGIGNALVFYFNSTTGGTDIIGKILSKLFKIKISISMLILDFLIAFSTGIFFGAETFLFSILGVCMKSFVLDTVLESFKVFKVFNIVSDNPNIIKNFVCNKLKRGATIHKACGAFTDKNHEVITTVLSRTQAIELQNFIDKNDKSAFIFITNSSRIIGNGFDKIE